MSRNALKELEDWLTDRNINPSASYHDRRAQLWFDLPNGFPKYSVELVEIVTKGREYRDQNYYGHTETLESAILAALDKAREGK